MGKIGDLFVRLGLKSDDYKKGINEAKKDTQGFGNTLGKMKAGAIAVWAAVGAGVTKLSGDVIRATNAMSDAFDQMTSSWKASYQNALAEISSKSKKGGWLKFFNLSDPKAAQQLGANAKAAGDAAAEATKAFDAEFELVNSVRLQRQAVQQELNELYIAMRDTTLSGADRQAAAAKYKAILQPIADAEVRVYGDMLDAAINQWQTGVELDRTYSTAEMTEFFTKIGTEYDKMAAKFPDLMRVYETRKSDAQNQPIFDLIAAFQQASNQMSNVDKEMSRTTNSIKASIQRSLEGIAAEVAKYGQEDLKLDLSIDVDMDEEIDMADVDEQLNQFIGKVQDTQARIASLNQMIEDSFVQSFSGAVQALTDAAFGIEGAGFEQVMAALLEPIASTAKQMGEMFMSEGLAIVAFENALTNPYALIAAGAALIAIGSAVSSGIAALTSNPAGGTAASAGVSSAGSSVAGGIETYEQEITVRVTGTLSGSDIVLAGEKTQNKWGR